MSDLPRRVLVLGLAVTGEAAALALAARGVEVVVSDRSPDADPGRLAGTGVDLRALGEQLHARAGHDVLAPLDVRCLGQLDDVVEIVRIDV